MHTKQLLGLDDALAVVAAILADASAGGPVCVGVADGDGALVCLQAMDGVSAVPRQLAPRKARAAALLGQATTALAQSTWAPTLVAELSDPTLTLLPGGAPIRTADGALGGVGVSGRSGDEDERLTLLGASILLTAAPTAPARPTRRPDPQETA